MDFFSIKFLQHLYFSLMLWLLMIAAVLIDLWDGVYTAHRTKVKIRSHRLRITMSKIGEYWRFMLIGFIIDSVGMLFPFYSWPYLSLLFFVGLVATEVKSMFEHARRRKSRVADLQEIYGSIIRCVREKDAAGVLRKVEEYLSANEAGKGVKDGED